MQVSLRSWNWQIIFCIQKYQISSCLYRHKQLWTLDCSFISFHSFLCTGCAYSFSFEQRLRIFLSLDWNDSGHTYSANACQVYLFLILFFSYLHIYYFLLIHVHSNLVFDRITNGVIQVMKLFEGRAFTCEYKYVFMCSFWCTIFLNKFKSFSEIIVQTVHENI